MSASTLDADTEDRKGNLEIEWTGQLRGVTDGGLREEMGCKGRTVSAKTAG
jgi:hypothetical protein